MTPRSPRSRPAGTWALLLAPLLTLGCPDATPPAASGTPAPSPNQTARPDAPSSSPSATPLDRGPPPPTSIEAASVVVGQHYRFLTEQGELTIRETWKVTGVEPGKEVRYDLYSTTEVKGAEPLLTGPTPKVLRLAFDDSPPPPGPTPVAEGSEAVEVSGARFACTVYRQAQTRRWISPRFPRLIKVEQDGKPFRVLVGIDDPE